MKIHFHSWVELFDVGRNGKVGNLYVKRHYRYCVKCTCWQRKFGSWGDTWWEDSDVPEGVEDLIQKEIVDRMFRNERRERNAKR